jgi:two-component system sensor histidine kinase PilS (NtrC family)
MSGEFISNSRTIDRFLLLRVVITTLVVGAGLLIVHLTNRDFSIWPICYLLVLSALLGALHYVGFRLGFDQRKALWSILVADIFIATAIVHYSGGVASPFCLIYCISIIAAAFLLEVHGGLGIALFASCSYIAYAVFQFSGSLIPPVSRDAGVLSSDPWIVKLYLDVSLFFLVGSVSGYLAERMKAKGEQLESAESELKQLRIDTDNILQNMSSGVLVVDSEEKILTINPAAEEILGLQESELVKKNVSDAFGQTMPELARELVDAFAAEEGKSRHEITLKNGEGRTLPLGISISILETNGKKRGVIAVFQDLSDVREMEARIRKADRLAAVGALSAGIAHEIRNPLASISGSIEMLQNELELEGEHRRLMKLITRESDRLDRIISDFLEFARMRPPTMRDMAVDTCIEDVLALLRTNISISRGIEIRLIKNIEGAWVCIDEEQMRQVFLNLCINACESMRGKGRLTIVLNADDRSELRIAILDEGPGIGEEAEKHLFEPFFTTKNGGTGLGLAIANKIIEAHHGRIVHRNRDEGGAEFCIMLPLRPVDSNDNAYETLGAAAGAS